MVGRYRRTKKPLFAAAKMANKPTALDRKSCVGSSSRPRSRHIPMRQLAPVEQRPKRRAMGVSNNVIDQIA
jgi:hypothetical protein